MSHFSDCSNILISGSSGSGKSTLVCKLLKHADELFVTAPEKIIYIYKYWDEKFNDLNETINFLNYIPDEDEIRQMIDGMRHSIIVVDDMLTELQNNTFAVDLFTRISHHLGVTSILILQDHTLGKKHGGTINKNIHYHFLTSGARNANALRTIGMQIGDYSRLKDAYRQATNELYGYLLISTHPTTDYKQRYKTNILPSDEMCFVFV